MQQPRGPEILDHQERRRQELSVRLGWSVGQAQQVDLVEAPQELPRPEQPVLAQQGYPLQVQPPQEPLLEPAGTDWNQ